jgi:hypothetical protein
MSGESAEVPVATNATYHSYWKRAAVELNLEMIDALGALWITAQFKDQFVDELGKLRTWTLDCINNDPYMPEMLRRIDAIVEAIRLYPIDEYEISFG